MTLTISKLPYEIISGILNDVARMNSHDGPRYTYGLSEAPEPLQDVSMQRVIRGYVLPEVQRWNAADSVRQVSRLWHDWAVEYALGDLHISRWRGSER